MRISQSRMLITFAPIRKRLLFVDFAIFIYSISIIYANHLFVSNIRTHSGYLWSGCVQLSMRKCVEEMICTLSVGFESVTFKIDCINCVNIALSIGFWITLGETTHIPMLHTKKSLNHVTYQTRSRIYDLNGKKSLSHNMATWLVSHIVQISFQLKLHFFISSVKCYTVCNWLELLISFQSV